MPAEKVGKHVCKVVWRRLIGNLMANANVVAFVVASIGWADVNAPEDLMISISEVRVVEVSLSERTTLS